MIFAAIAMILIGAFIIFLIIYTLMTFYTAAHADSIRKFFSTIFLLFGIPVAAFSFIGVFFGAIGKMLEDPRKKFYGQYSHFDDLFAYGLLWFLIGLALVLIGKWLDSE